MKLNRFAALGAIALLVVGALGVFGTRAFAQTARAPEAQVLVVTELPAATPAAQVDQQGEQQDSQAGDTGAQTGPEPTEAVSAGGSAAEPTEAAGASDTGPNDQSPLLNGSIAVTETVDTGSEAADAAALAGLAKITVEQAQAAALAANPGTTVVKAELGDENGSLVYSVELSNGSDVKVDAGNGAILATEAADANEAAGAEGTGG